jgi:hypothetical protein
MESLSQFMHAKRGMLLGLALVVAGSVQLYFYWRGKSLDTILSEDPQDPALRLQKRREGGAFGMVLVGFFLILYFVFAR